VSVTPGLGGLGASEWIAQEVGGAPEPVRRRRRRRPRLWRVTIFALAAIFFIGPLLAAFKYSLLEGSGSYGFANYGQIISNPAVRTSLLKSLEIAGSASIIVIVLMVPTVVWVRLRQPKLTPTMELVTLLPIVIPPVVMAAGLEELQLNAPQWMVSLVFNHPLTALTPFYVVLAMPFCYRAIDTGVRAIDLHTLVDASRNLGASWFRTLLHVVLPNVQTAVLGAMFLTVALCLGEVVIASLMLYNTFPVELVALRLNSQLGVSVAMSMITLAFTFLLLFTLSFLAQRRHGRTTARAL